MWEEYFFSFYNLVTIMVNQASIYLLNLCILRFDAFLLFNPSHLPNLHQGRAFVRRNFHKIFNFFAKISLIKNEDLLVCKC